MLRMDDVHRTEYHVDSSLLISTKDIITNLRVPKDKGWCLGTPRRCPSRRPSAGAVRPLPRPQSAQSSMHLRQTTILSLRLGLLREYFLTVIRRTRDFLSKKPATRLTYLPSGDSKVYRI